MQGNARGTYGSGCIVPEKCRRLPGECKGMRVKCWPNEGECRGMPGERKGMQGNTGEYREMPEERMGVGAKCQRNAGECWVMQAYAENVQKWVQSARNTGECQGNLLE